jgi:hypothetical protein
MIKPNIFVVVCAGGFCQEPAYWKSNLESHVCYSYLNL